jgi:aspartyl/asparaginyl beta-hydroxylase (cupin superfamily)
MSSVSTEVATLLEQSRQAVKRGDPQTAIRSLSSVAAANDAHPAILNQLGLAFLAAGRPTDAAEAFSRACTADSRAPGLWLNLADALRRAGAREQEVAALDRALALDAYLLPALLAKGEALNALGEHEAAVKCYRNMFSAYPDSSAMAPEVQKAMQRARSTVDEYNKKMAARMAELVAPIIARENEADLRRARVYLDQLCGLRTIYQPQPVGGHFPFLPNYEFFDERLFPWLGRLEAATELIRSEFLALWEDGGAPAPYVAFPEGAPVNQWQELNHSSKWGAYWLWRDGVRQDDCIAKCPGTSSLMESLPLLHLPGKGPTVMFSILEPHTRIPPHTGSTNIRGTVHLPLIVPEGCAFRVGGETRAWEEGKAWVFDDTIEHEAWNDSDQTRVILIVDCWNPYLTEIERDVVLGVGG